LIDDPTRCNFKPEVDLSSRMCAGDIDADDCFTKRQIATIQDIYRGPYDSKGVQIMKGMDRGSEWEWNRTLFAHKGNGMFPAKLLYGLDHVNFLFFEKSPGVPMPNPVDVSQVPDKNATPPEFPWWQFNIDSVTAGEGRFMSAITDAKDPDLDRFLKRKGGKLILYHGWGDGEVGGEGTLDYYKEVVKATFADNVNAAREKTRLFMIPGMGHCGSGPGCSEWDRLAPLVDWVENGKAPDYLVAAHLANGRVDNQRRVCAYPQRTEYVGPAGGQNDRANWVERNFACR
jgi:feruloyl esterase